MRATCAYVGGSLCVICVFEGVTGMGRASLGPTSTPGSPFSPFTLPDQKRCAQVATVRHWSAFFSRLVALRVQLVRRVSWFSSPRLCIRSNVPTIRRRAHICSLESEMSSSNTVKACRKRAGVNDMLYTVEESTLYTVHMQPMCTRT